MKKFYFNNITEQNIALGVRPPEHPLFDIVQLNSKANISALACEDSFSISSNFYSISLKHISSGEILYGRTKYDCSSGTMLFIAPNQEITGIGIKIDSIARTISLHEDYIRGHELQKQIKKYHFFSYAVNEALHLSPKEEKQIATLFDAIETEYNNNLDAFTKELILSLLSTMLMYADRYYHRQFLARKGSDDSVFYAFSTLLDARLQLVLDGSAGIPDVEELARAMKMTSRYLSDALKAETGRTTRDWIAHRIIDKSKDLLISTKSSVATIAYDLGFEYPQYFSRLFKNKVGLTPTEYRNENIKL